MDRLVINLWLFSAGANLGATAESVSENRAGTAVFFALLSMLGLWLGNNALSRSIDD